VAVVTRAHRFVAVGSAASILLVGCGLADARADVVVQRSDRTATTTIDTSVPEPVPVPEPEPVPVPEPEPVPVPEPEPVPVPEPEPVPTTTMAVEDVDELLAELQAGGFCDPADVDDEGLVTAMHFVVQGQLQAPCYADPPGTDDERLLDAWASLTAITPIDLVDDISLIAGYEACSGCDTLAFVTVLDTEATFFLLAVDVVAGADDPDELRLTMMHELTHVFAQAPGTQLIAAASGDGCATYYNGVGCFTADSYLWAWIQEFWPPSVLAGLPADGSPDDELDAEARCRKNPAYTGSYAAVHPEEDFAETFSAYVYDVVTDPALAEKLAFFDRYPEFVAIRDNARALGLSGVEANFDGCGS
jgi:hypothetical protein